MKRKKNIIIFHQFLIIFIILFSVFSDIYSFLIMFSLISLDCISSYFRYAKFLEKLKTETILDIRQSKFILCLKVIFRVLFLLLSIIYFIYVSVYTNLTVSLLQFSFNIKDYLYLINLHPELIIIIFCKLLLIGIMIDGIHEIVIIRNILGAELKYSFLSSKISEKIRKWRGVKEFHNETM